jgi:hypothetical protein
MISFQFNQYRIIRTNSGRIINHRKRLTKTTASTCLRHGSTTGTAKKFDNDDATAAVTQEPKFMTIVQRFQYFPKAFDNVVRDLRVYFLMRDALKTPRNQWTTSAGPPVWVRWKEQRMRRELAWIVPLAGACMLPFIGYIPSCLAFAFPRQMLTRHFWNDYEFDYFTSTALATRNECQKAICAYWWRRHPENMLQLFGNDNLHDVGIVDFLHNKEHPSDYWKQVALAAGCFSFLSSDNHQTWELFVPYWKWQARLHLSQLASDDTLLMKASSLQDFEVNQACEVRGLSMDRQVLRLYLRRIDFLRKQAPENDWGLISLLISGAPHREQL